jgi:hypothetical protein
MRIRGELLKLGVQVSVAEGEALAISAYEVLKSRPASSSIRPPSASDPSWLATA